MRTTDMLTGHTIETLAPDLAADLLAIMNSGPEAKTRTTPSVVGAVWGNAHQLPCGNRAACYATLNARVLCKGEQRILQVKLSTGYDLTPEVYDGNVAQTAGTGDLLTASAAVFARFVADLSVLALAVSAAKQALAVVANKNNLTISQEGT